MAKHECIHEQEFIQIRDDHKEMVEASRTHVSWTIFWGVVILLCGIFGGIMKTNYDRIIALEKSNNETNVASARIETQLSQIQKDLVEIKVSLKEHDKEKK